MKEKYRFNIFYLLGRAIGFILVGLESLNDPGDKCRPDCEGLLRIESQTFNVEGRNLQMELKEGYKVSAEAKPKTAAGHDAKIEPGSGRWTSSDESVVKATQDPTNELKAEFETIDGSANESVLVEFRADGIAGEGEKDVVISGSITATQGDAATGEMVFGTPEPVTPADGGTNPPTGGDTTPGTDGGTEPTPTPGDTESGVNPNG